MKRRESPETRFGKVSRRSEPSSRGKRPFENAEPYPTRPWRTRIRYPSQTPYPSLSSGLAFHWLRSVVFDHWVWKFRVVKYFETLNGRLPLEDSSDFNDFWTELILMTRSIIWDILRFSQFFFVSGGRRTVFGWSSDGRPMVVGRLFSHENFNFKFQLARAGAPPCRSVRPSRPAPSLAN